MRRSLGFDPLGSEALEDYRATLVRPTRQLLEAGAEGRRTNAARSDLPTSDGAHR